GTAPAITGLPTSAIQYVEGGAAVELFAGAVVTSAAADFDGGRLAISLVSGASSSDVFGIVPSDDISIAGSTLSYNGTAIGTLSGGTLGQALVVNLTADADATKVAALLEAVRFSSTAHAGSGSRFQVELSDGHGGAQVVATRTLEVDHPPVLVGPVGTGVSFSGTTESYLQASNLTGLGAGDAVTVEFWASFQSITHSTALSYVAPTGKTFAVYAAGNNLGVMLDGQAVALQALPGRTTSIVVDEWTHVAVSFDTSGRLELLRNGEVVAYATGLNLSGYAAGGGTLVLGQDQALAGGGFVNAHAMRGALDSVRVWNTARSAVDVQDGMDGTFSTGTTGLVASYSLDDVSGNTVANGVGGTNTLARFGDLGRAGLVTRIEDQGPYTTVLHGIDVDAGDTLTYSLTAGGGTDGTTTLTADGSLSFTPTANFHGTHTVSVEVTDSHGATYSRNLDIVVTAANDAPTPVTRSTYDFEGLTAGQTIDGQDGWVANNTDVTTVGTVASSGLYVGSTAYSPGTVAGVARVISRLADGDFAMPAVAAGDKIVLEYDFTPNYWGAGLQLGYDANSDGDLIGDTGEVAIGVGFRQEGGERVAVYDALGNATETAFDLTVGYSEWARFRLTLDTAANGGQGALSVQLRDLTHAGAWTTVVQNVNAHLDFNAITTAVPQVRIGRG
ncbi:MAG: hypothetical protein EPN20_11260, partial [Magnetospirillum sp.]